MIIPLTIGYNLESVLALKLVQESSYVHFKHVNIQLLTNYLIRFILDYGFLEPLGIML